jgi:hypothetical protein
MARTLSTKAGLISDPAEDAKPRGPSGKNAVIAQIFLSGFAGGQVRSDNIQ